MSKTCKSYEIGAENLNLSVPERGLLNFRHRVVFLVSVPARAHLYLVGPERAHYNLSVPERASFISQNYKFRPATNI